jgi:hypothetical protein
MQRAMSEDRWTQTAQNIDRIVGPLSSRELQSSGYSLLCSCYKFRYKAPITDRNKRLDRSRLITD